MMHPIFCRECGKYGYMNFQNEEKIFPEDRGLEDLFNGCTHKYWVAIDLK